MTSYFEIGGKIIELDSDLNDVLHVTGYRTSREHKSHSAMNRESKKALSSLEKSRYDSTAAKDSLFVHWLKTSSHPAREFQDLGIRRAIGLVQKPHLFAVWGSGKIVEVIGMHYDYFVQGESHDW